MPHKYIHKYQDQILQWLKEAGQKERMLYRMSHKKLKIEQHEPHKNQG
jgi:hypothetical protein